MKLLFPGLAAALCLFYLSCSSSRTVSDAPEELAATALTPLGRYQVNTEGNLELISSAAHVGFSFNGKEAKVVAGAVWSGGHTYLQYELDGVYQGRIRLNGMHDTLTISAPAAGKHTVWLYKTTEAHSGPLVIRKVIAPKATAIAPPSAPLIEFIGNSITCGAAADPSEVACGTGEYHDQHNAYMAYGPRVARALNTNFVLSCISGYGVYRNWNNNGPTLPDVYEKIDFQAKSSQRWDFKKFRPDVVSIALGTNDFSDGDGKSERLPFDSARFVSRYVEFVKSVKAKYPQAQVALLSSPMLNGPKKQTLENSLTVVKAQIDAAYPADKPVALYFFNPMQPTGCSSHPSVAEHGVMANELVPFFKGLVRK